MTEIEKLLPIGSVVKLQNGEKRLMIFGVKQTDNDSGIEYDYIGVVYPEGNLGPEVQFLFNHENIEEVFFRGYEDEERVEFVGKLADFYNDGK